MRDAPGVLVGAVVFGAPLALIGSASAGVLGGIVGAVLGAGAVLFGRYEGALGLVGVASAGAIRS